MLPDNVKAKLPSLYFDRVKLFVPNSYTIAIRKKSILDEIERNCLGAKLRPKPYGCTLDIHLPSDYCLRLLKTLLPFTTAYYISYVEITADFPCKSKLIAKRRVRSAAQKLAIKNNSHFKYYIKKPQNPKGRFFENKIWYWGDKDRDMKFVMYACYSKAALPSKIPCAHIEWRIRKSRLIRKYTGIHTIDDLIKFYFRGFFIGHCRRFLKFVKINHKMHGFHLLTYRPNRKLYGKSGKITDKLAARISRNFCIRRGINHPVLLRNYYRGKRGNKFMNHKRRLSDYMINNKLLESAMAPKFLRPIFNV